MIRKKFRSFSLAAVLLALAASLQSTVMAGPPLICHPFEIGSAKSLPWNSGSEWRAVKADYDLNRLVADTLALLTPETPVIVRMETMRRATIYAVWSQQDPKVGLPVKDSKLADELFARLADRFRQSTQSGKSDALATFDAGYLAASYRDAGYKGKIDLNGYEMMAKASALRGGDAEMEFAAAIATRFSKGPEHRAHLQKAIAGAKEGSLLARNLAKHFGQPGQSVADLRASLGNARD